MKEKLRDCDSFQNTFNYLTLGQKFHQNQTPGLPKELFKVCGKCSNCGKTALKYNAQSQLEHLELMLRSRLLHGFWARLPGFYNFLCFVTFSKVLNVSVFSKPLSIKLR